MATALQILTTKLASQFNMGDGSDLTNTLKATCFKGSTQVSDAQMTALLVVASQYGLNPFTKEIFAFPDKGGIVPVVGVDGWARIINNNPQFDGMDFEQDADSCACTIYRKDRSHPTKVTEWMAECKRDAGPWKSHPYRMLRHKAMIQCARLAFGYSGIYDQDEAERIAEFKTGMPVVEPEILLDVQPFIAGALSTKTDADAANYWKENNGKFAKQPADHATLKQAVIDHRMAMKEAEITDLQVKE
jgi:phage recombination protein Bet